MDMVIAVIVGLGTGVASSLGTAWLLLHGVRPRVEFSEHVSLRNNRLRVKVRNAGRRHLTDVEVFVTLRTRAGDPQLANNNNTLHIPVDDSHLPRWNAFRSSGKDKVLNLLPEEASEHDRRILAKGTGEVPPLHQLLRDSDYAWFDLTVIGTASTTGNRHAVTSRPYRGADIREGKFAVGSLAIAAADDNSE